MTDSVSVHTVTDGVARVTWDEQLGGLGLVEAIGIVQPHVERALTAHDRVEAWVGPDDVAGQRIATWVGLRREGVRRGAAAPDARTSDRVVFARLSGDPSSSEPDGFRALLNSFLPRKRAISQLLVRDHDDRVLLCQLTYKSDWDLPGGVVEVGESPSSPSPARCRRSSGSRCPPAGSCSPTGSRRGAAGTTPCAWSSTAAATTRPCWTAWSGSPARSATRSSARPSRSPSAAPTSPPAASSRHWPTWTPVPRRTSRAAGRPRLGDLTGEREPLANGTARVPRSGMGYVRAFSEGDKDQRDLLGGKGANLAEMTKLGLPVPPGFTITTEACRAYLQHGGEPDGLAEEVTDHLRRAGGDDGASARRRRRPAAGERAVGCQVLDAGDDGDRPQHRSQRRVGGGPGAAERRQAVRAGLLPAAAADVRLDRPGHRVRALRRRARRREAGPGHRERPRPRRRRAGRAGRDVQGDRARPRRPGVPAGPARAARPGDPRGLRLLEHRPRPALPPAGADPGGPRHGGERPGDGLRQLRHGLRFRRRVHPRPGQRRAGRVRRLPAERPGRGRRGGDPQHGLAGRLRRGRPRVARRPDDDHGAAGAPLPRHVRHRVHRRARQALDAPDPGRASGPRRRRSGSRSTWSTRA